MVMRTYAPTLNTFSDVEKLYNNTKPLVSKNFSKSQDVRPVWSRTRKWERIIKINKNEYLINDGTFDVITNIFGNWDMRLNDGISESHKDYYVPYKPSATLMREYSAIIWKRDKEGNEYIRVRNGCGQGAHTQRYTFLENTLPDTLQFLVMNGKQYVCRTARQRRPSSFYDLYRNWSAIPKDTLHFLPKSSYDPRMDHKYYPNDPNTDNTRRYYSISGTRKTDDRMYLWFKRVDGNLKENHASGWELCGDQYDFKPARKLVLKKRKARLKPTIEKFYQYIMAMYPLMTDIINENGRTNSQSYHDNNDKLNQHYFDWMKEIEGKNWVKYKDRHNMGYSWWRWDDKEAFVEDVLKADEHPALPCIARYFVIQSDLRFTNAKHNDYGRIEICPKRVRSQYNTFMNTILNLTRTTGHSRVVKR